MKNLTKGERIEKTIRIKQRIDEAKKQAKKDQAAFEFNQVIK